MKTIARILFIILSTIIFSNCSEDIYLHGGEDGQDGAVGPQGPQGPQGDQGFSVLMYFDEITQTKVYYLDRDGSGTFTMADTILYQETKEGVRLTQIGKCIQISEMVGSVVVDSFLVCNGEDGEIGLQGPQGSEGPQGEPGTPGQDGQDGTDGTNGQDGQNGTNGTNGQNGTNGTDGQDGQPGSIVYVHTPFIDNFNNGESHNYMERDYVLENTTLSINPYDQYYQVSPNGNGRLVKWEYNREQNSDSLMWFPAFPEQTAVDYFSIEIGSKKEWEVKMFFQLLDGTIVFIRSETTIPNDSFVWYLTYTQKFVYQVDISEIEYQDVVRVGLLVTKVDDDPISDSDWENETISMENVYIHRVKVVQ